MAEITIHDLQSLSLRSRYNHNVKSRIRGGQNWGMKHAYWKRKYYQGKDWGKSAKVKHRDGIGILWPLRWERLIFETRHLARLASTVLQWQKQPPVLTDCHLFKNVWGEQTQYFLKYCIRYHLSKRNRCHLAPAVIAVVEIVIHKYQKNGCHIF